MRQKSRIVLAIALLVTAASLVTWRVTGGDYYTKFRVVEVVDKKVDPNDPLVATGFYDNERTETVMRNEFRFGLLPTPKRILDKHALSVVSVAGPVWLMTLILLLRFRRRDRMRSIGTDSSQLKSSGIGL
jgi:hypothetical protein